MAQKNAPHLTDVRPLWLTVSESETYLLVEDKETGDILMPLVYMKSVLEANYSRKLSSLKHRTLVLPPELAGVDLGGTKRKRGDAAEKSGTLYWQWAFEAPHGVKVTVRQALGEESTPQGHLRLVLLPIAYNAMSHQTKLRALPFFSAMHKALRASSYYKLLKLPLPSQVEAEGLDSGPPDAGFVFAGPQDLARTFSKYTLSYESCHEGANFSGGQHQGGVMGQVGMMESAYNDPQGCWGNGVGAGGGDPLLRVRVEEVAAECKKLRADTEATVQALHAEVYNLRRYMTSLVNILQVSNAGQGVGAVGNCNAGISNDNCNAGISNGGMPQPQQQQQQQQQQHSGGSDVSHVRHTSHDGISQGHPPGLPREALPHEIISVGPGGLPLNQLNHFSALV
eukprot:CAMPEP_0182862382 /NCGR_PEP_ID=MMETSP0034_2-20130328/6027_1 /TAXON_ID=156128 /ORGANISM="Nephroselmis pyriformis, Strain CCMP717" /LENGTH=395 /DNA_ID=CAMNT_0024994429 /DNA_START=160 /DNA_END=1347 /DNA_ORIENTATION=-